MILDAPLVFLLRNEPPFTVVVVLGEPNILTFSVCLYYRYFELKTVLTILSAILHLETAVRRPRPCPLYPVRAASRFWSCDGSVTHLAYPSIIYDVIEAFLLRNEPPFTVVVVLGEPDILTFSVCLYRLYFDGDAILMLFPVILHLEIVARHPCPSPHYRFHVASRFWSCNGSATYVAYFNIVYSAIGCSYGVSIAGEAVLLHCSRTLPTLCSGPFSMFILPLF
jgi:hypothetical protein